MGIASANNVDFMIKGVFKFQAFGQELWVTTTEIGLSIGSTGHIPEYHGIRSRDA